MKKLFTALMMTALLLCLCACGNSRARNVLSDFGITDRDAQNALIEAANDLRSEPTSGKAGSDIDAIYEASLAQYGAQLEGEWVKVTDYHFKSGELDRLTKMTIEGSTVNFSNGGMRKWLAEDGKILMGWDMDRGKEHRYNVYETEITNINGFEMLRAVQGSEVEYYVRADKVAEFYAAAYTTVELTADNVKDYFEIAAIRQFKVDEFDEVTDKYRESLFFCGTGYRQGLTPVDSHDIVVEVSYPGYDRTYSGLGGSTVHLSGNSTTHYGARYYSIMTIDTNFSSISSGEYWEKLSLTAADVTLGRAKGTMLYLRDEFVDHVDEKNVYDVFGNSYSIIEEVPSESFRY